MSKFWGKFEQIRSLLKLLTFMYVSSHFSENVENKELCTMKLTEDYINQLKEAIEDLYYFEFVVGKFCTQPNTVSSHFSFVANFHKQNSHVFDKSLKESLDVVIPLA